MTDQSAAPLPPAPAPGPPGQAVPGDLAAGGPRVVPPGVGAAAAQAAAAAAAELPKKAADAVQLLVDTIHDKAVRPVTLVVRVLVFGLVVTAMAAVLLIMASIAALRLLDVYAFTHHVWLSYIVVGGLFTVLGFGAWSLRRHRLAPGAPPA